MAEMEKKNPSRVNKEVRKTRAMLSSQAAEAATSDSSIQAEVRTKQRNDRPFAAEKKNRKEESSGTRGRQSG